MRDPTVDALVRRCAFPEPGTPVTCAVSGGADSLALLVLAVAAGCVVEAVHVDHGLRPGSAAEAEVVASAAREVGASFRSVRVAVEPGPNLEARARAARYAVLPDDVLTGHTADDQAETVVLNVLRGAGLDGVAAMRRDGRRPLLDLRRSETRALCAARGLVVVDDPSNLDPRQTRKRVRHEVLPLMADVAGRDVVPLLARLADHARGASDYIGERAAAIDPTDAAALRAAPSALAEVAVREWLRRCSAEGHPPDRDAVARVLAVARGEARATDVAEGWRVTRSAGVLALRGPVPPD